MNIIPLEKCHQVAMQALLSSITIFTDDEVEVVNELLETYLFNESQKDYYFYVTREYDDTFSSFICFGPTPMTKNTFDLYWLGTHPDHRGKGLAHGLIRHMKKAMTEQGARLIRVETSSKELYAETQAFYDRLKFKEAARIKDFYQDEDDLITYIMNIKD
tara:strand:- start:3120 stop:3599 length:480 start_codon:yes stop_codon:yes gene_type:complete